MTIARALIIEDNRHVAEFMALAVREAGYETEIVLNGQLALDRLSACEPHLVILDLRLPRVGGPEILQRIRADERLADTHVLVVTAHWEDTEETVEGADLVLLKPIEFLQLRDLALRFRPEGIRSEAEPSPDVA